MDANGNMQISQDIHFSPNPNYVPPKPYKVFFRRDEREQMARIPLFQKAFSMLQAGEDFWARNAQEKTFIGLFMEYWPVSAINVWRDHPIKYPTCLDHKECLLTCQATRMHLKFCNS